MTGIKGITVTFFPLRETTHTAVFSQTIKSFFPSGQNLMRIRLMPYIPDHLILRKLKTEMHCHGKLYLRRFKHIVQRHCKLDRAQIGRKMPSCLADLLNKKSTDFFCKPCQFPFI